MRRKSGIILGLFGLALGLALGFGVGALKRTLKHELVALLDEEVAKACPCRFEVDNVDISLLTLKATASHPRIVTDTGTKLEFEQLVGYFGLTHIFNREIDLSELKLIRGNSDGIGPKSETYRFIDSLTTPLPPEQDRPDRWKLRLQRLTMYETKVTEPMAGGHLIALNSQLEVKRDERNQFWMYPVIPELQYDGGPGEPLLNLGNVSGRVYFTDEYIDFLDFKLTQQTNQAEAEMRADRRKDKLLTGQLRFNSNLGETVAGRFLAGKLNGTAKIAGHLYAPTFVGTLGGGPALQYHLHGHPLLTFVTLNGGFNASIAEDGHVTIVIDALKASSDDSELSITKPIRLDGRDLSGAWQGRGDVVDYAYLSAEQTDFTTILSGTFAHPRFKLSGNAERLFLHGTRLGAVNARAEIYENDISLDARTIPGLPFSSESVLKAELSTAGNELEIKSGTFNFAGYDAGTIFFERPPVASGMSGELTLGGAVDSALLEAHGGITLESADLTNFGRFSGNLKLENGLLAIDLAGLNSRLSSQLRYHLGGTGANSLSFNAQELHPFNPEERATCSTLSATSTYNFNGNSFASGSGQVGVTKLQLGCPPNQLRALTPLKLTVNAGALALSGLTLDGPGSALKLGGTFSPFSGFDVKADGSLNLEALIDLLPFVDDLSGAITTKLNVSGPFDNVKLRGSAKVTNLSLSDERHGIDADAINGELTLQEKRIEVKDLRGTLNGGSLEVQGTLAPLTPSASTMRVSFNGVELSPVPEGSAILSGQLQLSPDPQGQALLGGQIEIDSAEFQKRLDLIEFVKILTDFLFQQRGVLRLAPVQAARTALDQVGLDIRVVADRNLLFWTNWASAELAADIQLSGTLGNPQVAGVMETQNGWFGLKDQRFDITSGRIIFSPTRSEPSLEIFAETLLRTQFGDTTLAILEASGPLTAPRIQLSSDQGLSQKEILAMLSARQAPWSARRIESEPVDRSDQASPTDSWITRIERTLRKLARIDSITIEPVFNETTGVNEPRIIATKLLADNLALSSESSFGSATTETRFRARLDLTDRLRLLGTIKAVSNQQESGLGADVAYEVLRKQRPFTKITLSGLAATARSDALKALRLSADSRLTISGLSTVSKSLRDYLVGQGFRSAQLVSNCLEDDGTYCRDVEFVVQSGAQLSIAEVRFSGDDIVSLLPADNRPAVRLDTPATSHALDEVAAAFTRALRNEGYLAAKVRASYQERDERTLSLLIDVQSGAPVTFIFSGNTIFSSRQLLDTINLFGRKQPFGRNTINLLIDNIEALYRESGYLYATIHHSSEQDGTSPRIIHRITIDEGAITHVGEVSILGNTTISTDSIRRLAKQFDARATLQLFAPEFAIAEQLTVHADLIRYIYQTQGFPDVKVTYQLEPRDKPDTIDVIYVVEEGQEYALRWLELSGWPAELPQAPPLPEAPYSIEKLNRYIEELSRELSDYGFRAASIETVIDPGSGRATLLVKPGPATAISSVIITGSSDISEPILKRELQLADGQRWDRNALDSARARLLKSGLFQRIQIEPLDGAVDSQSETLLVRVSERPARSLELGTGLDSADGLHLFGEATERGLLGDGKNLLLRGDVYYDSASTDIGKGVLSLRYLDPYFPLKDFVHSEDLRFIRQDNENLEFDYDRISLTSSLFRSWSNGLKLTSGHTILEDNLDSVPPDVVLSDLDTGIVRLSFLSGSLAYDGRDDFINPSSGINAALEYKVASEWLGSEADFAGLIGRVAMLWPLDDNHRWSLANATRAGMQWAFGDSAQIPITQRYYLGGANSIRGFRENSLGPRGVDGNIIGGDVLLANNLELRYLISDAFSLHTFFDVGNVYLEDQSVSLSDLRESVGIGFRFISPIGPIGFDLGHPLDEKPGEPSLRLHFNIGSSF